MSLDAALAAVASGLKIFPALSAEKKSHKSERRSGSKWGMTDDPDQVKRDWARWPNARVGLPTGALNRILVLDIDSVQGHGVDGHATLLCLEAKHGTLPATYTVVSPSDGWHLYYMHPGGGVKIKNSASELGPGIDVRGDGGFIVGAGSINKDGRAYRVLKDLPIAEIPPAWLDLVKYKRPTIRERATAAVQAHRLAQIAQMGGGNSYANAALRREIGALANTAPNYRNDALNKSAFNLFQFVHAGLLIGGVVERELIGACHANGLVADDGLHAVIATIRSGANGAREKPRRGFA
jgi:Bifunctional DNA primase/polymerase, N-terminal